MYLKAVFSSNVLWANVILTPDDNKMIVFSNGILNGSNGCMPFGGHWQPILTAGVRALWKKAQKKLAKKQTSDTINRIIPNRKPRRTIAVCWRSYVDSTIIALNQPITPHANIGNHQNSDRCKPGRKKGIISSPKYGKCTSRNSTSASIAIAVVS